MAATFRESQLKAANDGMRPETDTAQKRLNRSLIQPSGAAQFIDQYYVCVNGTAQPLRNFYVSSSQKYTSSPVPALVDISINGQVLAGGPDEYETMLKTQRMTPSGIEAKVRYEVEGWDVHILNPEFTIGCPDHLLQKYEEERVSGKPTKDSYARISLLVQVTGTVSFGGDKENRKMFNDVLVLVPNWDNHIKNPPRNAKRWLILSQNFRAL